jgi:hypothetical protein
MEEVRRLRHVLVCRISYLRRSSQIKPLTEEERRQKLAELREKIAAKRGVKAQQDAKEARANEAIRRKSGKVSPFTPCAFLISEFECVTRTSANSKRRCRPRNW